MTLQYDRTIQDGGDIPAGIASIAHAYARLFLERLGAAEEGARPETTSTPTRASRPSWPDIRV